MPKEFHNIEKYCENCGKLLVLNSTRDIKKKKFCSKKCTDLAHKTPIEEHKHNNPDYERKGNIRRKYNLFYEDWLKIWEGQDEQCAICGKSFEKLSDAFVDHNHKTSKVRGLLCQKCNFAIGHLNDDPKLMMRAAEYLMKGREL